MRLILLRHAVAVERDAWAGDDASRPLTKQGVEVAQRVLRAARPFIDAVEIWTSPWLRARATAEMAAEAWDLPLRSHAWLAHDGPAVAERAARIDGRTDVVLVGHEPDLGELAGHLCGGAGIKLKKAGLAVLVGEPVAGGMTLRALLTPRIVLGLARH